MMVLAFPHFRKREALRPDRAGPDRERSRPAPPGAPAAVWRWWLGLLVAAAVFAASGQSDELPTLRGSTMGTRYTIRLAQWPEAASAAELQDAVDQCLERVNDQMSTWRPDSELSRFNRFRETGWFDVSPETAEVIAASLRIGQDTGGAFDVTVGKLVNLWQFGPDAPLQLPSAEEVAAARDAVGYEQLDVREHSPAIRKRRPDLYVDLSGVAKGFGVDEVARVLDGYGIRGYLVEIGGEIRTKGTRPDGTGWRVGIEAPTAGHRSLGRVIELSGQALATSGDYRNFRLVGNRRLSHTIDPRTGRPVEHHLASATVVAEECLEADALATALMVLGPDAAYAWAVERDLAAWLMIRNEQGIVERPTPAFSRMFPDTGSTTPTGALVHSPVADRDGRARQLEARGGEWETTSVPVDRSAWVAFAAALVVFAAAAGALGIGLLGRRPLRGSCGGLSGFPDPDGRPMCDACPAPQAGCGRTDSDPGEQP
jgi:thiamine biosynthesis lipoprotein